MGRPARGAAPLAREAPPLCLTRWRRPFKLGVMAKATVAEEEYLQIMFWLEEAGLPINGANIARAMQLSPPTVGTAGDWRRKRLVCGWRH